MGKPADEGHKKFSIVGIHIARNNSPEETNKSIQFYSIQNRSASHIENTSEAYS